MSKGITAKTRQLRLVLLDDNLIVRNVSRNFIGRLRERLGINLQIYTSQDGVQGLGYVFITEPDVIIIDTTLPKYSGRELIDYLVTNPKFNSSKAKIIILHLGLSDLEVPKEYVVINKNDPDCLPKLLEEISLIAGGSSEDEEPDPLLFFGKLAVLWANRGDLISNLSRKYSIVFRPLFILLWLVSQIFVSANLTALHFLSRPTKDDNLQQANDDMRRFRISYYPAIAAFISILGIIALQMCVYIWGSVFFFTGTDKVVETRAAAGDDFKIQRNTTTIGSGNTTATLTAGVDYDAPSANSKAFVRITNIAYTGAGHDSGGGNQNSRQTTVTISGGGSNLTSSFQFVRANSTNTTRVSWEIVEYIGAASGPNEIVVRNVGELTANASTTQVSSSAISGVADAADMVVFITGQRNSQANVTTYNELLFTSEYVSGTNVARFTRADTTNAAIVSYAAVEFTGSNWKIQRISHTYTAANATETENMTTINSTSKAFIHAQKRVGNALTGLDEFGHEVWISSTTQVSFFLQSGSTSPSLQVSVAWVIENTQTVGTVMNVIRGSTSKAAGGTEPSTVNVSYGPISDLTRASVFANARSSGTGTTYPNGIFAVTLTSTSNIEFWYSDSAQSQAMRYEVVEWPTAPTDTIVSSTGTQNSAVYFPVTNYHIGGAFTFTSTTGSRNVTGITIREQGTVDGQTAIDNIKLYYDSDTSAPYDCASESYAGSETQFGTTDTDGFSAANGTAAFTGSVGISTTSTMCVYVVFDVPAANISTQTIEIDIADPTTAVTTSAGSIGPTTAVTISGTSTLTAAATVTSFGTQSTSLFTNTTNNHTGGGFGIASNNGSLNVTSIKITETGSVNATSGIDNVKLFYESDTTAPYDCASESYAGTETQYGATDTDSFDAANGNSTFTATIAISATSTLCIYPVLDLTSSANAGETLEIEITTPWDSVSLSAGTSGPTTSVSISGTTTITAPTVVSTIQHQAPGISTSRTAQYLGGVFTITSNSGSKNVTSITLREQGTVDASSGLDNIMLLYESDTTTPYDCYSVSYNGSEAQFGSTDTDGFSAANGNATFTGSVAISTTSTMCVYVVLDVTGTESQTLEIDIANPSTDIVVSSGTASPTTAVAISGTTTITTAGSFNEGMFIYPDGTSDVVKYRTISTSGVWSVASNMPDIDAGTTNRRGHTMRVYSTDVRDEYIVLQSHADATNQYLYAQVFNGSSWGNLQQLTTFSIATLPSSETRNYYSGTYLDDGTFMAVYSDLTNTPKFSIWNGSSWSTLSASTQDVGGVVNTVVAKSRPGTNEVMVAVADQQSHTNTIYYDGAGTATTDWSTPVEHGIEFDSLNNEHIDFTWSSNNPLRGLLYFNDSFTDTTPNVNIFTADGSGGGSWGTANEAIDTNDEPDEGQVIDRPGTNEFLLCISDTTTTSPDINCLEENDNDTTPTLKTTVFGEITTDTDNTNSPQHPFDLEYEQQSANPAIVVYSDTSSIPRLKKYDPTAGAVGTWDELPTNLADVTEAVEEVDVYTDPGTDNMIIILRTNGLDLHTVFWDGTNNFVYTTGDRSMTEHSTNSGQFTTTHTAGFAWKIYNPNAAPSVNSVSVNGGSNINLTENTTTTVQWTATITDTDGYADISSANGKLYRSGVTNAETCSTNNNNCYADSVCSLSGCSGNSCTATCEVSMQFHADPTDTGTYASEYWRGWIEAVDNDSATGTAFSAANTPDVNSTIALNVTSAIAYGTLEAGANTGSTNQTVTIINSGNIAIDSEFSGTNLCSNYPTCSGTTISVGNQEYSLTTFTYGSGTDLTVTDTAVQVNLSKPTAAPSNSTIITYWGIGLPSTIGTGGYTGENSIVATVDN